MGMTRARCAALILTAGMLLAGCGSDGDDKPSKDAAPSTAPSTAQPPATTAVAAPPPAPVAPTGGPPPKPDPATQATYIAALNAINPQLVDGKEDRAVSRGRDTCTAIGEKQDRAKLVANTQTRFGSAVLTVTPADAEKILTAVHDNLCPTY